MFEIRFDPKKYWTEEGLIYIRAHPPGGQRGEELVLNTLEILDFESLLDIGCGFGRYLSRVVEMGVHIKGMERLEELCERRRNALRKGAGDPGTDSNDLNVGDGA